MPLNQCVSTEGPCSVDEDTRRFSTLCHATRTPSSHAIPLPRHRLRAIRMSNRHVNIEPVAATNLAFPHHKISRHAVSRPRWTERSGISGLESGQEDDCTRPPPTAPVR